MEKSTELTTQNILTFDIQTFYSELEKEVKPYLGLVYTEETIGDAKKTLAEARQKKDNYNKERIELCRPYKDALSKVKAEVDDALEKTYGVAICEIQKQVTEVEEQRIAKRKHYINETYKRIFGDSKISLDKIQDKKWINKGTSTRKILTDLQQKFLLIQNDEQTLRTLADGPFLDDVLNYFYETLSLNDSIAKLQELKVIEQKVVDVQTVRTETVRPKKSTYEYIGPQKKKVMSFKLRGTEEELKAVKAFVLEHNIEVLS